MLWFLVFAVALQLGVLVFCAMAIYHPPWKARFGKNGLPVVGAAYPVAAAGVLTTTIGMFLCAWIIEQSTKEEVWKIKVAATPSTEGDHHHTLQAPSGRQVLIFWLQKRKIVNDQTFDSYTIFTSGPRNSVLTSRRNGNVASPSRTTQLPGGSQTVETGLPHQKLVIFGATISIIGFILNFSGLRLMHWSATIAQFVGTAIMTSVRIWLCRDLAGRPDAQRILDGYEMDWLALLLAANGESLSLGRNERLKQASAIEKNESSAFSTWAVVVGNKVHDDKERNEKKGDDDDETDDETDEESDQEGDQEGDHVGDQEGDKAIEGVILTWHQGRSASGNV